MSGSRDTSGTSRFAKFVVGNIELETSPIEIVRKDSALLRLILGSGRSGTTWVLDCLADANELRPIFEPLHPSESAVAEQYAYQILAAGETDQALERYFLDLAAGAVRSRWIDYRGPNGILFPHPSRFLSWRFMKAWVREWRKYLDDREALRPATKRSQTLIKCIRANLIAGWLSRSLGFRTVLIVRHPCAVVESQFRLRRIWDPKAVLERYRANRKLHELTGERYVKPLNSDLSTVQALTLNWIIENQWPVERSREDGYSVVFYEDLVLNPGSTWRRLCNSLELANVPDPALLQKPSQQAALKSTDHKKEMSGPRWRTGLTPEQLDSIQDMLDATNCSIYRTDTVEPTTRWNIQG
jgi:hypothetical protein